MTLDDLLRLEQQMSKKPWQADDKKDCGSSGDWGVWQPDSGGQICLVGDPYRRGDNAPYENMLGIAASRNVLRELVEVAKDAPSILQFLVDVLVRDVGMTPEAVEENAKIIVFRAALARLAARLEEIAFARAMPRERSSGRRTRKSRRGLNRVRHVRLGGERRDSIRDDEDSCRRDPRQS